MSYHLICKGCGHAITGQYFAALGAEWHLEHFLCSECHKPILENKFADKDGVPYHIGCYEQKFLSHCSLCGKVLRAFNQDYWGNKYCSEHLEQYPACRFCGRLIPKQKQASEQSNLGFSRCGICDNNAVEVLSRAQPLFTLLFKWLSRQGLMFDSIPVRLGLYNIQELQTFYGESDVTKTLGVTKVISTVENGIVINREINIAILRGIPSTLFQGVAVHELGHAWLTIHGITDLPGWAKEGFCELLSHHYYSDYRTIESIFYAQQIETANDSIYGDGFRRLRDLTNAVGFSLVIDALLSTKHLPV